MHRDACGSLPCRKPLSCSTMTSNVSMLASFMWSKRMLMSLHSSARAYLDINQLINGQDATEPLLWSRTTQALKSHTQGWPC